MLTEHCSGELEEDILPMIYLMLELELELELESLILREELEEDILPMVYLALESNMSQVVFC